MLCWTVRPSDSVSREQRLDACRADLRRVRDDLAGQLLELLVLGDEVGLAGELDHGALGGGDQSVGGVAACRRA